MTVCKPVPFEISELIHAKLMPKKKHKKKARLATSLTQSINGVKAHLVSTGSIGSIASIGSKNNRINRINRIDWIDPNY